MTLVWKSGYDERLEMICITVIIFADKLYHSENSKKCRDRKDKKNNMLLYVAFHEFWYIVSYLEAKKKIYWK
jgi:hypothetical protein